MNRFTHIIKRIKAGEFSPRRGKRGSLFVDAACVIPVFVISVTMLLSLVNQAGVEQQVYRFAAAAAEEECRVYAVTSAGKKNSEGELQFLKLTLPAGKGLVHLVYRPYLGESSDSYFFDSDLVFVFPKYGERYHTADCSILKQYKINESYFITEKSRAQEDGYTACKICGGGD